MGARAGIAGVIATVLGALAFGCAAPEGAPETAQLSSPIIYGSPDTDAHDSVVLIAIRKSGRPAGSCTGTMVAPNLVLTARHCVSETDRGALCKVDGTSYQGGAITADADPSDLLVYTGKTAIAGMDDDDRAAARGIDVIFENTRTLCDRDVAFIVLNHDIDTAVAPMRLGEGAREGESLTAVGWGLTEDGVQPEKRMQRGGVRVEAIGPLVLDADTNIGLARSEFLVGEAFCSGDSGGPSFATTGAVVGVVSRGGNGEQDASNRASKCIGASSIGFYTHLANKSALVTKAFAASGYEPRDEGAPPGKARGQSCKKNLDCSSNACIEGKCLARCDSAGKCGAGEICATKSTLKVCVEAPEEVAPPVEEEPAPAAAPMTPGRTITTTTCSAGPIGGASGIGSALFGIVLATVIARRRRA